MDRLERLLRPRSIAVIGGGVWGAAVIAQCRKMGFAGDLWVVHPTKSQIGGVAAYADVAALPAAPDAAFVAVNRRATVAAIADLAQKGAGGAICFASGFREAVGEDVDADALQADLLTAAGDMPIVGPNCYGFLNYLDSVALWPDEHGGVRVQSGVALIMQSSNVALNMTMQRRGLPIAYVVTVGNQAQTGLSQIGLTLLRDPRVTALGLYIEGIDDLRAFEALAIEARRLNKRIVVLKAGRSAQAQSAAISHTASISGSAAGADALFARMGVGQVRSLSQLLETLKLLHVIGPLPSARIGSMSCSGGEASLMADAAHGTQVCFPPLEEAQIGGLRKVLGPLVALSNPLDYHTYIWGDVAAMTRTFAAMMRSDLALGIVVLDFPRPDRCDPKGAADWGLVIDAVAAAQDETGKPIAVLSSIVDNMPEPTSDALMARGILPLCGMEEAMTAIAVGAEMGAPWQPPAPLLLPEHADKSRTMSEVEAKSALRAEGLRAPSGAIVTRTDARAEIGWPVALKAIGIAHKTEASAVMLGLEDPDAVTAAMHSLPGDEFLMEEMVQDGIAELLIGIICDAAHGYVLTLAAGGTLTELLGDAANLLLPVTADDVSDALDQLKISQVLKGYRGKPPAHRQSIIDAVLAVQSYVLTHRPLEVEVNPLICGPERAVAVDALIRTGECDD